MAAVLLGIYAWYVKGHFEAEAEGDQDELAPLRFHRLDRRGHRRDPHAPAPPHRRAPGRCSPSPASSAAPTCSSAPSSSLAAALGVSEILLALVIAPIATELPEKFNSLIWVRQGKDTLAMGNITGRDGLPVRDPDGRRARARAGDAWSVGPRTR